MKINIDKETGFSIPLAKEFEIFDLFKLKNRTAIITGSANGIGRIAAIALGKAGANIAITDIDFPAAKELEEELSLEGIKCKSYLMDAAKENNIKETFSKIDKDLGDVDILVNNAGAAHRSASEDMSTENFENIIKLNLTGSFICAKTAAKRMLKNKKGCIINIASIMGVTGGGPAPNAPYHASKGGIVNLTRSLANEWGPKGIRVNAIGPTYTKTRLIKNLNESKEKIDYIIERTPLRRLAEVTEMAGGILYLASDASSMVTGHTLMIDGGWSSN